MGCDIHLVVETKVGENWVTVNTMNCFYSIDGKFNFPAAIERNYKRFAAIASVRGDGLKPKGLPKDISETAQYLVDKWGTDGHSHTWLSLPHAVNIFLLTETATLDPIQLEYPESFYFNINEEDEFKDHRLIIWFDN